MCTARRGLSSLWVDTQSAPEDWEAPEKGMHLKDWLVGRESVSFVGRELPAVRGLALTPAFDGARLQQLTVSSR